MKLNLKFNTTILLKELTDMVGDFSVRNVLNPVNAKEIAENGEELSIYQFSSLYAQAYENTSILIPVQKIKAGDGLYHIVIPKQISQQKINIRFVKTTLFKAFTNMQIQVEYNQGENFITLLDKTYIELCKAADQILESYLPSDPKSIVLNYLVLNYLKDKEYNPAFEVMSDTPMVQKPMAVPALIDHQYEDIPPPLEDLPVVGETL